MTMMMMRMRKQGAKDNEGNEEDKHGIKVTVLVVLMAVGNECIAGGLGS